MTDQQPNNDSYYFRPLLGIKGTFGRILHVFRLRWRPLVVTSAIPIFLWYVIAIGIRSFFNDMSQNNAEIRSFEMNGDTINYKMETLRTTLSRLGLVLEFFLVFFLFLPADAVNIRMIAGLYAGDDISSWNNMLQTSLLPIIPSLAIVGAIWCVTLMLPMLLLIWCMAPEGQMNQYGIQIYYQPWLPKLVGGLVYLILSSVFMLASYFCYSILVVKGGPAMASFQESLELFQSNGKHMGTVIVLWFLIKVVITKVVSAINWWYYLHEKRFWIIWDQPGIPLLPIRILWSTSNDLWEIGRSWISVPFVILIAAMSSVFQAVLYMDTRIKKESYTRETLRTELGLDDDSAAYKTMKNPEADNNSNGIMA
jgi:hypothetical protein